MKYIALLMTLFLLIFTNCKKDQPANPINSDGSVDVQKITLRTTTPNFKNDLSVRTGGNASIDLSKYPTLEFGVCYGADRNPSENDTKLVATSSSVGDFEVLIPYSEFKSEELHIRAYIKDLNTKSIKYGDDVVIKKSNNPNDLITDITNIVINTTTPIETGRLAVSLKGVTNMDLTKLSGYIWGVCYGNKTNPTVDDETSEGVLQNISEFNSEVKFKNPEVTTTYYLRAYVRNYITGEIYYGNIVTYDVNPIDYITSNINGKYVGVHHLKIPAAILQALSDAFPADSITGEKLDLMKGFSDTLTVTLNGKAVVINSSYFKKTLEGRITGDNIVKIDKTEFAELYFGPSVTAKDASLSTAKDIIFSPGTTPTTIEMRLTAKSIATFTFPLDIITTGSFVRQ